MRTAIESNNIEQVRRLMQRLSKPSWEHWQYPFDLCPLHKAVFERNPSLIEISLNQFDPNAYDEYKRTAMHWASFNDDAAMIRLLLKSGTIANASDRWSQTPLHLAVERSCEVAIEALSEFSNLEIRDDEGIWRWSICERQPFKPYSNL